MLELKRETVWLVQLMRDWWSLPCGLSRLLCAAAFVLAGHPTSSLADVWALDASASEVRFTYDHFGLSRQSGRLRDLSGRLRFSPTEPENGQVEVSMKVEALSTGNAGLDRILLSPDFFDAKRHPTITFKSTGVAKTGDRTGELRGDLTMLGITQPVTLSVRWNYTGEYPLSSINPSYIGKWVSGFSAKATIQRSLWGMQRGVPVLADEIEIAVEVEFLKTSSD